MEVINQISPLNDGNSKAVTAQAEEMNLGSDSNRFHNCYISTQKGMRGYFAVLMKEDDDGFPSPQHSGLERYKTKELAEMAGRKWSVSEGIPFLD